MKHFVHAATISLALIGPVILADASMAQRPDPSVSTPKIKIEYAGTRNADLAKIYQRLRDRHVLETLQEFLSALRLPREFTVRTAQCSEGNALKTIVEYTRGGPVTICYELMQQVEKHAVSHTNDQDLQQKVIVGTFVQVALHEVAYAIFDVLEIPVWGREFDAADRLAALIIMQFGDDVAQGVMLGASLLFLWSDQTWQGNQFASTASPDAQRFFNYACIAVAANYPLFGGWVENGFIPADRAGRCEGEYNEIRKAFDLRVMPYVDPDMLVKLRSTNWLAWTPNK